MRQQPHRPSPDVCQSVAVASGLFLIFQAGEFFLQRGDFSVGSGQDGGDFLLFFKKLGTDNFNVFISSLLIDSNVLPCDR
jgi:hypothetical protein